MCDNKQCCVDEIGRLSNSVQRLRDENKRLTAELEQAKAAPVSVPDGWKVVKSPVAMVLHGPDGFAVFRDKSSDQKDRITRKFLWRLIHPLNAAPPAPAVDAYSPLIAPSEDAREVFAKVVENNPDADMRAIPNQWLLDERALTEKVAIDLDGRAPAVDENGIAQAIAGRHKRKDSTHIWVDQSDAQVIASRVATFLRAQQQGE